MPFTFEPMETRREGDELVLRGRVVSGAYFGPESALLRSPDGLEYLTHIHSHGMEYPEGWPVLPEHRKTVLILRIPVPPADFRISLLTGVGSVESAINRLDISDALSEPAFWAMQLSLHFSNEEVDDPGLEWLGVTAESADEWYATRIQSHIDRGTWPYVRVTLPSSRYIELEMAGGVEYQDRIWIGHLSGSYRVLLGYHSGHFSFPALRVSEVAWLAGLTDFSASNLLWLAGAYLEEGVYPIELASRLTSRVPGISAGMAPIMAEALLQNLAVEGLKWVPDQSLGWVNNWIYSQRNTASPLSILKPPDFAFIRQFFT